MVEFFSKIWWTPSTPNFMKGITDQTSGRSINNLKKGVLFRAYIRTLFNHLLHLLNYHILFCSSTNQHVFTLYAIVTLPEYTSELLSILQIRSPLFFFGRPPMKEYYSFQRTKSHHTIQVLLSKSPPLIRLKLVY